MARLEVARAAQIELDLALGRLVRCPCGELVVAVQAYRERATGRVALWGPTATPPPARPCTRCGERTKWRLAQAGDQACCPGCLPFVLGSASSSPSRPHA